MRLAIFTEPRHERAVYLVGLGLWLVVISAWAVPTVTQRHFQVDEFQNAYNCRLLFAAGQQDKTVHAQPYMVPLGFLAARLDDTSDILLTFRGLFFLVFVVNLLLAAHAQYAFPSRLGRWLVLLAFSFLFPLWAYGMEFRHDNLLLTGELALYFLTQRAARRGSLRRGEAFWGGVAVFWTFISAHKGFAYALPYGALLLLVHSSPAPPRAALLERAKLAGWLVLGTVVAAGVTALGLFVSGVFGPVWSGAFKFAHHLEGVEGFPHWVSTLDAVYRYPHLFALGLVLLGVLAVHSLGQWPFSLRLTPAKVTAAYLVWSFVVLSVNPAPYPYNLLHFLPFVLFAALAALAWLKLPAPGWQVALVALALANGVGWINGQANVAYASLSNELQLGYIRAAEALTDPAQDSVLDGVGMVLTRNPPDRHWQLHGSFMAPYRRGERTSFVDLLATGASPVVLTNYRWGWLGEPEWSLLQQRYLLMAKDFWVLGGRYAGEQGSFEIHRDGRYFVASIDAPKTTRVVVDGVLSPPAGVRRLSRGLHSFTAPTDQGLVVSWAGPHLETPMSIDTLARDQPLLVGF